MALLRPRATATSPSGESRAGTAPREPWFIFVVAGLSALALAESLAFLGRESFWLDEAYSVFLARLPRTEFWDVLTASQANASLYYVLLRGWITLGTGETIVRFLSVISAVACVPLCYAVGKRLFGPLVGVTGAALLAVNAFAIQYAQEARSYSLVLFLVLLSSYLFVRAVQEGSAWTWTAYVLVTAISGYAHFFAWFVVIAHVGSLPFLERRPRIRAVLAAYGCMAVLSAPLLVFLLTTSGNQIGWIPPLSVGRVASALGQLAGARTILGAGVLVAILAVCSLFAFRTLIQRWRRGERSAETWGLVLVVGWLAVPIGGALAISVMKPIWVDKYLIVTLPGLALTAAFGLSTWKPTLVRAGLTALLIASVSQVLVLHLGDDKDDWRAASRYVLARSGSSDGIAFYRPYGRFPFGYYVDDTVPDERRDRAPTPISAIFDRSRGSTTPGPRDIPLSVISNAAQPFERVWIVLNPVLPASRSGIGRALEPDFTRAETAAFRDVVVELYVRRPTSGQA
jgi:mannosyltransferase